MLKFHPNQPFPILSVDDYSYRDLQLHSEQADRWLGLNIPGVETTLERRGCRLKARGENSSQQLWIGLAAQSLLTPYIEIRNLIEKLSLRDGSTVVDLGAGYARMGFVIGRHYPKLKFIGFEYVGERVQEALRVINDFYYPNVSVEHVDLSAKSFRLPKADAYFIYDYGTSTAINKSLFELKRISTENHILIVARGVLCHELIETQHSWLYKRSRNLGRASIYSSLSLEKA
jgi:precorrin-6B methylase 2